ncbi:MAG: PqqD family protein [Verrucomicrobiales bacterium]|nr:PqqD family protein [Verrucomicrobiales bacterium]
MTTLEKTYELVTESVASEIVEGEVIIVHFDSGNYFSLRGAACAVWGEVIERSVPPSELTLLIEADEETATEQLERFIGALVTEEVIRPSQNPPSALESKEMLSLTELIVEKYEDMQLLLLGDPIHEVESEGWPIMREGAES